MSFLEEQFDLCASFGVAIGEGFSVEVSETKGGNEYRQLNNPYPKLELDISFENRLESVFMDDLVDLFRRSGGTFGGFRYTHVLESSTNGNKDVPTYADQLAVFVTTKQYQITKWYGTEGDSDATRRRIRKPRAGSVVVGIRNQSSNSYQLELPQQWSVDTTTGIITFDDNLTDGIVGITNAAQAVVDFSPFAHPFSVNDTVHFSDVGGMVQINGLRALIVSSTATTITIDLDTQLFDTYTTGGNANTEPQTGEEEVLAGCYFDFPMRFTTDISGATIGNKSGGNYVLSSAVQLIEILNPQ